MKFSYKCTLCHIGKLEFNINCSYLTQHWISLKKKQPVTAQNHSINPVPKEVRWHKERMRITLIITINIHKENQCVGSQSFFKIYFSSSVCI